MAKLAKPGTVSDLSLSEIPLGTLMGAEFTVGKRWWWIGIGLDFIALVVGFVSGALTTPSWLIVSAAIASLVASILGFLAQRSASQARGLGEETRRYLIYTDGLGWEVSRRVEAGLRLRYSWWAKRIVRGFKHPPDPYYESTRPPGPQRLLDHLQESVFFQAQLSARMAGYARWATTCVGIILLVGVLLALFTLEDRSNREVAAKILGSIVLLLVTSRVVLLWREFDKQAVALNHLDEQLDTVRKQGMPPTEAAVLQPAHEYDIAVLDAPPVPDAVYRANRDELNALWQDRQHNQPSQAHLL